MSYSAAVALQSAVYQRLVTDSVLTGLVGDAIYDAMPVDPPAGSFVSLGPETVLRTGDSGGAAARHDFVVSVLSGADQASGFRSVKAVAAAVADALETDGLELDHGVLAGLWFLHAKALRVENGAARRVDMTFRAQIDLG